MTPHRFLDKLGIEYVDRTNRLGFCCPFHHDTTPSAGLYLDTLLIHCFACEYTLGMAGFYAKAKEIPYREALIELGMLEEQRIRPALNAQRIMRCQVQGEDWLRTMRSKLTCKLHSSRGEMLDKMVWEYSKGTITEPELVTQWEAWKG